MKFVHIKEGFRIFRNSRKTKKQGYRQYSGGCKEICRQIIEDCWNGEFFQTSTGNFPQFWTRDLGWCAESLVKLGYEKRVHKTLTYALRHFSKHGKTTTTITPDGRPFDFPTSSVDTLPYLFRVIKVSGFDFTLHKSFLQKELERFYEIFIDKNTGLVRSDKHFSSMKDYAKRKSSCYDNAMVASLKQDAKALGFSTPLEKFDYKQLLIENFWQGEYFYDDSTKKDYIAGDANVFPFWLGVIKDEEMLKKSIHSIQQAKLDNPFPLKYTGNIKIKLIWQEFFVKGYERDSVWMHMGPLYVDLVKKINPERASSYTKTYKELIEKHRNTLEVFDEKGNPFRTWFYQCDQGMLWAANFLTLLQ